jgi:predicted phage terminase large subunit-like protein
MEIKGGGKIFKREWFRIIDHLPYHLDGVRFWDLAATSRDVKEDAFYTASVKMAKDYENYYVLDFRAEQLSPAEADEWILRTAKEDGYYVPVRWELEGGSAGPRDEQHLKDLLAGYDACGVKPLGDKVTRAKPVGTDAKNGKIFLVKNEWNNTYKNALYAFDGTPKPLTNDATDATSGAWAELQLTRIAKILHS